MLMAFVRRPETENPESDAEDCEQVKTGIHAHFCASSISMVMASEMPMQKTASNKPPILS